MYNKNFKSFKKENDNKICFIHIQSGTGGLESRDWVNILAKIYIKWANINNLKTSLISNYSIKNNKNKNFILKIFGKNSYNLFKNEIGIHKLIRKSPFDFWKRHTTFASVNVYNYNTEEKINIIINDSDLKIDFYKSSGSGGQHVNKTESAVRVTHIPTKIVSICKDERSQHRNKIKAIKNLKNKLEILENKNFKYNKKKIHSTNLNISWGNCTRSYILDNSLINDIKTGIKTKNIKSILNGNIGIFIKK